MRAPIAFLIGVCAWAQSGLVRPQLGTMLDAAGSLRPLYGLAGSITLGDASATGVLSLACSRKLCLAKTEASVVSPSQAVPAPPGPALFAIGEGSALVYFRQTRQLARWRGSALDYIDFSPDGEVLALGFSKGVLEFAVRRDRSVWIMRGNDAIDALPGDVRAVSLLRKGVLYSLANSLVLRRPDGSETVFDAEQVDGLFPISDAYVQARAVSGNYAVRVEAGREGIVVLPEAPR